MAVRSSLAAPLWIARLNTRRLAHPHRHAKLLALRDREVDVPHQDVHLGAVLSVPLDRPAKPARMEVAGYRVTNLGA